MAGNVLDPTGLQEQSVERLLPTARAVKATDVPVGSLGEQAVVPATPTPTTIRQPPSELMLLEQQAYDRLDSPLAFGTPPNVLFQQKPLPVVNDQDLTAEQFAQSAQAQQIAQAPPLSQFPLPSSLVPSNAVVPTAVPSLPNVWNSDPNALADFWRNRVGAIDLLTRPNTNTPLLGLTRSMSNGVPFSQQAEISAEEFYNQSGVSLEGDTRGLEPVRPPSLFDRIVALPVEVFRAVTGRDNPLEAIGSVIPGPIGDAIEGIGQTIPLPNAREVAAGRRIIQAGAQEALERANQRRERVGNARFAADVFNSIIPTPGNAVASAARRLRNGENPVSVFNERPQPFVGFYGTTQQDPFIAGVAQRSPEFRNLLRALQPTLNEAGEARFNPGSGQFGEFAQAGSLSALLYLANIPEGVLTGALYDIADLYRETGFDTLLDSRAGEVLRGLLPVVRLADYLPEGRAPRENWERRDVFGAFIGRDYGFTQEYSENRYLATIGNPRLPRGGGFQVITGFLADMAVGGFADFGADTLATRAGTRAARLAPDVPTTTREPGVEYLSDLDNDIARMTPNNVTPTVEQPRARTPDTLPTTVEQPRARTPDVPEQPRARVPQQRRRTIASPTLEDLRAARIVNKTDNQADEVAELARLDAEEIVRVGNEVIYTDAVTARRALDVIEGAVVSFPVPLRQLEEAVQPLPPVTRLRELVRRRDEVAKLADDIARQVADYDSTPVPNAPDPQEVLETLNETGLSYQATIDTLNEEIRLIRSSVVSSRMRNALNDLPLRPSVYVVKADEVADVPFVPASAVTSVDLVESVIRSRFSPIANDSFTLARRSNEQIGALAQIKGDVTPPVSFEEDILNRISKAYGAQRLVEINPTEYLPVGKALPPAIIEPDAVVRLARSYNDEVVDLVPERLPEQTLLPEQVADLDAYVQKLGRDFIKARKAFSRSPSFEAKAKLDQTKAALLQVYEANPEYAIRQAPAVMPDDLRPIGGQSEALLPEYLATSNEMMLEARTLQELKVQLVEVEVIRNNQSKRLAELPRLERIDPGTELSTRRVYSGQEDVPYPTHYKEQPTRSVLLPEQTTPTINSLPETSPVFSRYKQVLDDNGYFMKATGVVPPQAMVEQVFRSVDALNYRQLQKELKAVGLLAAGKKTDLADRLAAHRLAAIRTDIADGLEVVNDTTGVTTFSNNVKVYYHGTKAVDLDTPAFSLTNEFGPGLYVTQSMSRAQLYADAQPADDLIDMFDFTPNLDNQGRVFEVVAIDRNPIDYIDAAEPNKFNVLVLRGEPAPISAKEARELLLEQQSRWVTATEETVSQYEGAVVYKVNALDGADDGGYRFYVDRDVDYDTGKETYTVFAEDQDADELASIHGKPAIYDNEEDAANFAYEAAESFRDTWITNYVDDLSDADVVKQVDGSQNLTQLFFDTLQVANPDIARRFKSWSKNKHPRQYWHYVRSQFLKDTNSQQDYYFFARDIQDALKDRRIDAIQDGDTLVILSQNYQVAKSYPSVNSTGSIEEGLRNRIQVDRELNDRLQNKTTQAIVEQNQLAFDTYARNALRDAVAQQEKTTVDAVTQFGITEAKLERAVDADRRLLRDASAEDGMRDAVNQHNADLRRANQEDICL